MWSVAVCLLENILYNIVINIIQELVRLKKAAIYVRVSTQEQANEGYSIEAQQDRLNNYCKAMNYNIHDVYIDGGWSGSRMVLLKE